MTNLTERWINIYKSKEHESYWTGTFGYKTKEEAAKDLADKKHYLTTVNIEDMLNLQTQNTKLKAENKQLCKKIDELYENIDMRAAENAKFRELLEEVLQHELSLKEVSKLTRKISEVLGKE